jgi:hypothetical protein
LARIVRRHSNWVLGLDHFGLFLQCWTDPKCLWPRQPESTMLLARSILVGGQRLPACGPWMSCSSMQQLPWHDGICTFVHVISCAKNLVLALVHVILFVFMD